MRKLLKVTLTVIPILVIAALAALAVLTRDQVLKLISNPPDMRQPITRTPASYGLPYEDVIVVTADGLKLAGWYLPSHNGAAILMLHGFRGDRTNQLDAAEILQRHGYGVLLASLRGHDQSEGDVITLGKHFMEDVSAWHRFLLSRPDVDADRIGILGESLGGAFATRYAAENRHISVLVLDSTFATVDDTFEVGVHRYTILPAFPTVAMMDFWAEREVDVRSEQIDPIISIREIGPCPVLIMQGGADDSIAPDSGEALYRAAGEPKEYWFEPGVPHHGFHLAPFRAEFEQRLIGFLDHYLLPSDPTSDRTASGR